MQSRLASKLITSATQNRFRLWIRPASSKVGTADPAIHSGDLEGIDAEEAKKAEIAKEEGKQAPVEGNHPLKPNQPSKPTSFGASPKLKYSGVKPPLDPTHQQKRRFASDLKDVSCVGIDGWTTQRGGDRRSDRKRQEEEDKEYFKDHKASPLSEIQVADTRKSITRAQDAAAGSGDVLRWREEQLETAEETLLRAAKLWREQAMRGVPDYPHSRVLRELLRARGDYSLES